MRVGIDSYSYHRLLGELRPGEPAVDERLPDGGPAVIAEARALGVDGVALETCFLAGPPRVEARALAAAAAGLELALSWGAPNGLEFGRSETALRELVDWIEAAAAAGIGTLRIVVAGPALRDRTHEPETLPTTAAALVRACAAARACGVALAVENHGDLRAGELATLLELVDDETLGVCFDTANALRVGDDAAAAAALLGPWIRMVHLKDVEALTEDTDVVGGPRSVRYGDGVVPLEDVLEVLDDNGFDGLVCVEIAQLGPGDDERELVADGVRWLRARPASA